MGWVSIVEHVLKVYCVVGPALLSMCVTTDSNKVEKRGFLSGKMSIHFKLGEEKQ